MASITSCGSVFWIAWPLPVAGAAQQGVKFPHHVRSGTRQRSALAPAEAGAIVGAHAREFRGSVLNLRPRQRKFIHPGFENKRGAAFAEAVQMQTIAADVEQLTGRRELLGEPGFGVGGEQPGPEEQDEEDRRYTQQDRAQ